MSINKSLQQHRRIRNTVINLSLLITVFAFYIASPELILVALAVLNGYGWRIVVADKQRAQEQKAFRFPETTFLLIALCGGAWATLLAMQVYRHKTKHWGLCLGVLCLGIGHLALLYYGYTHLAMATFFQ